MFELFRRHKKTSPSRPENYPVYVQEYFRRKQTLNRKAPWAEERMVIFDTETTGLKVGKDQILSIGQWL